jgi:histidyl-tRNA synthetase
LSKKEEIHFNKVTELLKILNINYSIDPSIVRGLDYYTDTVWEFEPKNETSQSTIGAGGRYNNLIKLLGGIPGAGFASGIERSLNLSNKVKINNNNKLDIYIIPLSEQASAYCFRIIDILVKQKYSFVTGNYNNSIKSQLRSANNANAKLSFIIGDNEIKDSSITIKFLLDNKEDVSIPIKNLYEKLSSL